MIRFAILVLSIMSSLVQAEVLISDASVRLLPPGMPNTSAYFTIENRSDKTVVIVGAKAEFAKKAEIHNHVHQNGMMKMQQQDEVVLAAKQTLQFSPGGLHIMLFGLNETLKEHQTLQLSVLTKDQQIITFTAKVQRPLAHKHHD